MKAIQLSGPGRAGKSTVASLLYDIATEHNYIPVIVPFAKALKDEAKALGYVKENSPEEYRAYCQRHGAGKRQEDPDYWIKKTDAEIDIYKQRELVLLKSNAECFEHLIIQDDVRYMNELAYGRTLDAYQIFVSSGPRPLPELFEGWRNHESEKMATHVELGDKDYTELFHEFVENRHGIEELQEVVKERFITWVSTSESSTDPITQLYKDGENLNEQFMYKMMMDSNENKTEDNMKKLLEAIEDSLDSVEEELDVDYPVEGDDDDSSFLEGAD